MYIFLRDFEMKKKGVILGTTKHLYIACLLVKNCFGCFRYLCSSEEREFRFHNHFYVITAVEVAK